MPEVYPFSGGLSSRRFQEKFTIFSFFVDKKSRLLYKERSFDGIFAFGGAPEGRVAPAGKREGFFMNAKNAKKFFSVCFAAALALGFPLVSSGQGSPEAGAGYEFTDFKGDWRDLYDEVWVFSEGLAEVREDERSGFVNEAGDLVIDLRFKEASHFELGLAAFKDDNGKWGYIDKKGNAAIEAQFDDALAFQKDYGLAVAEIDGKQGFINPEGEWAIKPEFDYASGFSEGLSMVFNYAPRNDKVFLSEPRYSYINTKGETVIKLSDNVTSAGDFKNGLALVQINDEKWGYINQKGEWVIRPQFDDAEQFYEGEALVKLNGRWRAIRLKKPSK